MQTFKTLAAALAVLATVAVLPAQAGETGNGLTHNGIQMQGRALNDLSFWKITTNGISMQGTVLNDLSFWKITSNGISMQGRSYKGAALDAAAAGLTIHMVELADGTQVELQPHCTTPVRCADHAR